MTAGKLLLSFYGDDFTGSTDAMESLAMTGVRTVLFTSAPSAQQLARYPGIGAIGVAGMTRSMPPDEMELTLGPVFAALRSNGSAIVHYKVCSTFDSSPRVGSIGRAIEVGMRVFGCKLVPIVVGAPSLGRYCVFGNLFARYGGEGEPYRLDRHPSMSRHPVTPMDEADLRMHLAKQTNVPIELFDVVKLSLPYEQVNRQFDALIGNNPRAVLIDLVSESQLATVGRLVNRHASAEFPLFVVGSSGVESALCAHWHRTGVISSTTPFLPVQSAGPIVAVCGSCSPVTAAQIEWAINHGFTEIALDSAHIDLGKTVAAATKGIGAGSSVVIHTGAQRYDSARDHKMLSELGATLGSILFEILAKTKIRRVLVAGGDTSGKVALALGIESLEMTGELTRGSPLCGAHAPGSPADGIEITFKGGQIGNVDFFGAVQSGNSHA